MEMVFTLYICNDWDFDSKTQVLYIYEVYAKFSSNDLDIINKYFKTQHNHTAMVCPAIFKADGLTVKRVVFK
jgi:hypothetical protein